jgi:hypothetical protein
MIHGTASIDSSHRAATDCPSSLVEPRLQQGTLDARATDKFLKLIAEAHRREDWFADGDPKPGRSIPIPPSIGLGWRHIAMGFSIAGSAILKRLRR